MRLQRILVPTDFSPSAEHAGDVAVTLAGAVGGTVTLVHVYATPTIMTPDGSTFVATPAELLAATEHAEAAVADAARRLGERAGGVPVSGMAVLGAAAQQILALAASGDYDLVVIGTHGRRGLGRIVLGSVAETVMRRSLIPVVTVRGGAERQPAASPPTP